MIVHRPVFLAAVVCATLSVAATAGAQLPHNIPDFCANATLRTVDSGKWTDPDIWDGARVPGAGDIVSIEPEHTVSYGLVSNAVVACVGVRGQLDFRTNASTRLTVGTLEVLPGGTLTVGTATTPVESNVTAEIVIADQALNTTTDPEQFGTGLIGLGVVRMHGQPKTPYRRLASAPSAGHTTLTYTSAAADWQIGDRIAIPDSKQWLIESWSYVPEWETATLSSASSLSTGLSAALLYDHPGARDADDQPALMPHVANLTRNVIVRSANPAGTRGHVIFVTRADVDVRYVAFQNLGRTSIEPLDSTTFDGNGNVTHVGTNQIGRYAMHFHHVMGPVTPPANGHQFTFVGNAIDGASKWGIAIHQASYGLVSDNVIYDSFGAGVMTEDGNESFNVIERNFVLVVRGTGQERADARGSEFGFEGSAYWFHGPNNYVRDNIGASTNSFGVTYAMIGMPSDRVPKYPGADLTVAGQYDIVDLNATPLLQFEGNELYGAKNGLTAWNLNARCCETVMNGGESTVKNFRLWHISRYGYYGYGQNKVTFDGWTQYGSRGGFSNPYEWYTGFFFSDYITRNLTIRNSTLHNLKTGIHVPPKTGQTTDIYGDVATPTLIENSSLRNIRNIYIDTPWGITGGGAQLPPRKTIIKNISFGAPSGYTADDIQTRIQTAFPNNNLVKSDEILVEQPGDIFRVYFTEAAPSYVLPQTGGGLVACPASGLTNAQCWTTYGVALGGKVATCSTTRSTIVGFACP